MPADIVSVIVAGSVVTYLMYKNISKIGQKLNAASKGGFESYALFSAKIQDYIRKIKKDVDDDLASADPKYFLLEDSNQKQIVKDLTSFIRELAFFETILAKKKTSKETENALFSILSKLDEMVRGQFRDGEKVADELREEFHVEYAKVI